MPDSVSLLETSVILTTKAKKEVPYQGQTTVCLAIFFKCDELLVRMGYLYKESL